MEQPGMNTGEANCADGHLLVGEWWMVE